MRRLGRLGALLTVGIGGVALGIGIGTGAIPIDGATAADTIDAMLDLEPPFLGDNGSVEVEVANGGGVAGMAREATDVLQAAGFDVVIYGNADAFSDEPSVVIARTGNTSMARAVADTLGIDNVLSEPDPNLYVDVSVVVGREWQPPSERARDGAVRERTLWDPRTWFEG